MQKKLLVAVVIGAFSLGALTLVGCSKKKTETETTPSMGDTTGMMAPAESTGMMPESTTSDTTMH